MKGSKMNNIKGFKAMNADMTCRGFKFEIGKTYESKTLAMCSEGFHFCENLFDVYSYYPKETSTIICEVEALGEVQKEEDKSVTNKIKIVRKLEERELLEAWIKRTNSGDWNSGNRNSGDWNSGNGNSGNRNSGDWNSGDGNSGYFNTEVPVFFFNKPSEFKYTKDFEIRIRSMNVKPIVE
jgi:hypothetical protein